LVGYRRYEIRGHSIVGEPPPTHVVEQRIQHYRLVKLLTDLSSQAAERSADAASIMKCQHAPRHHRSQADIAMFK
jgi:hypothetical protein